MVFYFKEKLDSLKFTIPNYINLFYRDIKGDIKFSKNINTLQNYSPFHRFIKKFLKIFQAHENYIASLPPNKLPFSPKQMDVEANSASKASCCYVKQSV